MQYDEKRLALEAIIIPDLIGIPQNAKNLKVMYDGPVCQRVSRFIDSVLIEYTKMNIPVIGIGHGAAALWNHLGNPISVMRDSIVLLQAEKHFAGTAKDEFGLVTKFAYGGIYGIQDMAGLSSILSAIAENAIKDEPEEFYV